MLAVKKLMKLCKNGLLVAVLLMPVLPVWAQKVSKVGTTAANFLEIPVGTRASAMGGAVTATIDGPTSMYWNPAGLASLKDIEVSAEAANWPAGITHSFVGIAMPVGNGAAGINITAMTMTSMEVTTYDYPEGTGQTFAPYSVAVGATFAQYLLSQLSLGANVKFIQESIMDTKAMGIAFDVGTMYTTPFFGIRFGVDISNVGPKMRASGDGLITPVDLDPNGQGNYKGDANLRTDPFALPLQLRVGLAWDAIKTKLYRITVDVDGNSPTDNDQSVSVGGEISFLNDQFIIRGGLPELGLRDRIIRYAGGIGISHHIAGKLNVSVGYSYTQYKYLNSVNRISLKIGF